jgi:hypothetical protein
MMGSKGATKIVEIYSFAGFLRGSAAAVFSAFAFLLLSGSALAQTGIFDRIGIGVNWGPHWSTGPDTSQADARDTQDDGAFPPELCLVRNAGFKTIRMYGENPETWIAALDAIDDYNNGRLTCDSSGTPGRKCGDSKPCMSAVYQVAICGPDPASLNWNGKYGDIESVTCYDPNPQNAKVKFADSVRREIEKLKQVVRYSGKKFSDNVPLVIVGNEILYSRGVCSNSSKACTENRDCSGGQCNIRHYCSDQLEAASEPAECASSPCGSNATCTDVTNIEPLAYAFEQVSDTLKNSFPAETELKLTISLQADVLSAPPFGDGTTQAPFPLMYSRKLLRDQLSSYGNVLAANIYPDQWGMVKAGGSVPPYPSCVNEKNAVEGPSSTLPADCAGDNRYLDSRTGLVAHSIADYMQLYADYYPGLDVVITETGWHTDGTCSDYNDSKSTYSAAQASAFYSSLYDYSQANRKAILAFELFDQKTKQCNSTGTMAEANYGIFTNFCQLKADQGTYGSFLPKAGAGSPGANITNFLALLDKDPSGGKSCRNQTLFEAGGVGDTGVCYHNPEIACMSGYITEIGQISPAYFRCPPGPGMEDNPCVWGVCSNLNPARGCNPDDPANDADGCKCARSGICANTGSSAGVYTATRKCAGTTCNAACMDDDGCSDAIAPFTDAGKCSETGNCGCFAAMVPSTVLRTSPDAAPVEGPGFNLIYRNSSGQFTFRKNRTLGQKILQNSSGGKTWTEVEAVWGNIFLGTGWQVSIAAPSDSLLSGDSSPQNAVKSMTAGTSGTHNIVWQNPWTDNIVADAHSGSITLPRAFLAEIPAWPPAQANLRPHLPDGWADKLVISKLRRKASQDSFTNKDLLFADWAVINSGDKDTSRPFRCSLYVDGRKRIDWMRTRPLSSGRFMTVKRYPLGFLKAGEHTIEIRADSGGVVNESDKSDNSYSKRISVKRKQLVF